VFDEVFCGCWIIFLLSLGESRAKSRELIKMPVKLALVVKA